MNKKVKWLLGLSIQLVIINIAVYLCITYIMDLNHNWGGVLGGSIPATIMYIMQFPFPRRTKIDDINPLLDDK